MVVRMIAGCWLWLLAACGGNPTEPPAATDSVRLVQGGTGLDFPLFLPAPPRENARRFIVEKTGKIRIVKSGSVLSPPFLDLSARVSDADEQGLLGLAFHPQYAVNGRFVVDYTAPNGDPHVSAFRVSANPDVADPASEQVLLAIDQPFDNHNGGMVVFGPDGKLYIGMGDGGSAGDPQGNGQNKGVLLGKILRVDVSGAGVLSVPADNPFVGQAGARPEIWSYGLRNPWRFSFDRAQGDLYIADVGQNAREEVDVATSAAQFGKGLNFGWNVMEGVACYSPPSGCPRSGLPLPVLDYDHGDGCSVIGGYVYRGAAIPSLRGRYFFADYCGGWVRSFLLQGGAAAERRDWPTRRPGGLVTSFGEDAAGELYVMNSSGKVFRIAPAQP